MNKKEIRVLALKRREALSVKDVLEKSREIMFHLEDQQKFKASSHILFYHSHQNEVSTLQLIEKYLKTKHIYLPRVKEGNDFDVVKIENLNLTKKNKYGIPEPIIKNDPSFEMPLDLIILPGVAFGMNGGRIGMGKGYYDRFLNHHKRVFKIALAYEIQIFDEVPEEPYDERVDMIITEKRVIYRS